MEDDETDYQSTCNKQSHNIYSQRLPENKMASDLMTVPENNRSSDVMTLRESNMSSKKRHLK
jgi:hypothetical protein